jgi:hypothetical protein
MSIYATMWTIQIEDESRGGSFSDAWHEVYAQGVPNHINEQNGYGGERWDDWLPAFVHQSGCKQRAFTYYTKPVEDGPEWLVRHCDESDEGAEKQVSYDCLCGMRAVFIVDRLTTKGTERNGQEYVNPVLVLTGAEYEALSFGDLLQRIEESVSERLGRPSCMEPGCVGEAVHTVLRKGEITEAWCEPHDVPKLWKGQRKRRKQSAQEAAR